mmetsp:Transcript_6906/g.21031  ORF Transcript_6906/g.21031 Transcript_6906/m.21031 type:complete len:209 (+) Transcript_6906:1495-2121(+)
MAALAKCASSARVSASSTGIAAVKCARLLASSAALAAACLASRAVCQIESERFIGARSLRVPLRSAASGVSSTLAKVCPSPIRPYPEAWQTPDSSSCTFPVSAVAQVSAAAAEAARATSFRAAPSTFKPPWRNERRAAACSSSSGKRRRSPRTNGASFVMRCARTRATARATTIIRPSSSWRMSRSSMRTPGPDSAKYEEWPASVASK